MGERKRKPRGSAAGSATSAPASALPFRTFYHTDHYGYSMSENERKFLSRETAALIVGMSVGMGASTVVHSLLGVTNLMTKMAISAACMYLLVTILERALTTENTT